MGLWSKLSGGDRDARARQAMQALYSAIVQSGRKPAWYLNGGVADSVDGRFDMISSILALVLLRMERDTATGSSDQAQNSVWLTELFVDDMDGQLREFGIGDMIVGKHVGRLMGALGGRLGTMRDALTDPDAAADALADYARRNIHGVGDAGPDKAQWLGAQLLAQFRHLCSVPMDALIAGQQVDPA